MPQNLRIPLFEGLPASAKKPKMRTALYRHFDVDQTLLYVGISLSWPTRTKAHSHGSAWFNDVAKVEIEWFPSREAALDAERTAIKAEKPRFNVVHNRDKATWVNYAMISREVDTSDQACRFMSSRERKRLRELKDPVFGVIKGPDAIVGPALVYQDDVVSVMVAHGETGQAGELTEVVLGNLVPEAPEWVHLASSVIVVCGANEITMAEAKERRADMIRKLVNGLRSVSTYDSDLALAIAYATQFPSGKSRQILHDVSVEHEAQNACL